MKNRIIQADFIKTDITTYMMSEWKKPCFVCGQDTRLVEIYSEKRICSDECTDCFYNENQIYK